MNEPSLWKLSQADSRIEAYRCLWLPSFHHPMSVRITRSGERISLKVIVLDGAGGYDPGWIAVNRTLKIESNEWTELLRSLDATQFWNMPSRDPDPAGEDGDQLIVEGVKNGHYHGVDRWGAQTRAYARFCKYFLDLSRIHYQKQWDEYH